MSELARQQQFKWTRTGYHPKYNSQLSKYKVISCLEQIGRHCDDKDPLDRSLLDIACGDGYITEKLSPYFSKIIGLDANSDVVEQAKKRVTKARFFNSLAEDYQSDEKFSSITLLDLLEHVQSPVDLLKHLKSMLKPEGVLIVHVPNALAINRQLNVLMGSLTHCEELSPFDLNIAGHRRSYCMKTLLHDINSAGLVPVDQGGIFLKLLSTPQMDYLLSADHWDNAEHGWGRSGDSSVNWKDRFCEASYKLGAQYPELCNVIHVTCKLPL